ncbi:MAG: hypothetical protein ABI382_03330 [Nakamurella sp.]
MTSIPRRLAASIVALVAPLLTVVAYITMHSRVPDPLPVHWNIHGAVDNTASVQGFFTATLAFAAVLAVGAAASIWLAHSPMAGRMLASMLVFGAWLASGVSAVTFVVSDGAEAAEGVTMPWYAIVAILVVPIAIAVGVWALLPSPWPVRPVRPTGSTLSFAPGEVVTWIGHAHSNVTRVMAAVLALAGAVALMLVPAATATSFVVPLMIAAVVMAMVSEIGVRIDVRGLHTLWGPFGWPRPRIALADIVAADAEEIRPTAWGGWGYRVSSKGVAAVVRRGPGLVIQRAGKPTYAVTVDRALEGADVLNALLNRAHSA